MLDMKRQDMEELKQLLQVYASLYDDSQARQVLDELSERYQKTYGESIMGKRNPRGAGRKRRYTETERSQIQKFREEGQTIREIAGKTGLSIGYVQGVLSGTL